MKLSNTVSLISWIWLDELRKGVMQKLQIKVNVQAVPKTADFSYIMYQITVKGTSW